jgi:hypothetical protein
MGQAGCVTDLAEAYATATQLDDEPVTFLGRFARLIGDVLEPFKETPVGYRHVGMMVAHRWGCQSGR